VVAGQVSVCRTGKCLQDGQVVAGQASVCRTGKFLQALRGLQDRITFAGQVSVCRWLISSCASRQRSRRPSAVCRAGQWLQDR
jgi:hypothetical protein